MQITSVVTLTFLIVLPLCVLLIDSTGGGKTLEYFEETLILPNLTPAFLNTILFALGSTILALTMGIPLAWVIGRTNAPYKTFFDTAFITPLFISPFIGAMGWVTLLGPRGLLTFTMQQLFHIEPFLNVYSVWGMIWINGIYEMPFIYLFTSSALRSMDPSLEESSMLCGVSTLSTALRVTLPLVTPAIFSAGLLVLVSSFSRFAVPLVVGRPHGVYVLSTVVYDLATYSLYMPERYHVASALAVILLALAVVLVYVQRKGLGRREFFTITGKGYRPRVIDLGGWRILAFAACLSFTLISLVLPFLALGVTSLMAYYTPENPEFTLGNFEYVLYKYPITARAFQNSLFLAFLGATVCIFLTFVVSYVLVKSRARGKGLLEFLTILPVALPAIVLSLAILTTWVGTFLHNTLWVIMIAYITIYNPYGIRALTSGIRQIHPELEDGSKVSGVPWSTTVRRIILPLLKPSFIAGWSLLFIAFLREVTASILLSTYGNWTLSVAIHELWHEGSFCQAASLAIIQLLMIFAVVFAVRRIAKVELSSLA